MYRSCWSRRRIWRLMPMTGEASHSFTMPSRLIAALHIELHLSTVTSGATWALLTSIPPHHHKKARAAILSPGIWYEWNSARSVDKYLTASDVSADCGRVKQSDVNISIYITRFFFSKNSCLIIKFDQITLILVTYKHIQGNNYITCIYGNVFETMSSALCTLHSIIWDQFLCILLQMIVSSSTSSGSPRHQKDRIDSDNEVLEQICLPRWYHEFA